MSDTPWDITIYGPDANDPARLGGRAIGAPPGGSQPLAYATATLSAAQVADLHDNPVILAAAPGASKAYVVFGATIQRVGGSTPYTSANGRILIGPRAQVVADYTTWETGPASESGVPEVLVGSGDDSQQVQAPPSQNAASGDNNIFPSALVENEPLAVGNPNADFEGGDYGLLVCVFYGIGDVA